MEGERQTCKQITAHHVFLSPKCDPHGTGRREPVLGDIWMNIFILSYVFIFMYNPPKTQPAHQTLCVMCICALALFLMNKNCSCEVDDNKNVR